jgi:hypothetical protein
MAIADHTEKPRTKILTTRELRILDVLWNSWFIRGTPGALIEDAKGLSHILVSSDPGLITAFEGHLP